MQLKKNDSPTILPANFVPFFQRGGHVIKQLHENMHDKKY